MRSFIAILLLAIVALAAAQTSQDTFVISYLETGQTQPADNDETFETAALENGAINVVITASYPVEVCFQEGYFALGSLDATCNPEGYIPADSSSVLAAENKYNQDGTGGAKKRLLRRALEDTSYTFNYTLYLRDNTQYGVSARWAISDDTDAQNQTGSVQIAVTYTLCPANKNGYGPGCANEPVQITPAGAQAAVNAGTPAFFSFAIDPATLYNELILTVHFTAATPQTESHLKRRDTSGSPVQIYARRDAYPIALSNTTTLFDPSTSNTTSSTTNSTSLTFNGPEQGTWFVLVNTAANITYNVNVTVQGVSCPTAGTFPTVNNATDCIPPVPILSANYVPVNGSSAFPANGTTFDFAPASGGITYFTYETAWLLVGVVGASHGSTGAPGIYASATSIPSAASYEVGSDEAAQVNFLNVKSLDDNLVSWIIAVQPLETSDNNGFQIFAGFGCANNCTGHGSCPSDDGADGYCTCNSGYKDFACSTQKLKTIYIVLIAIGGAIVLAIAIGVPVGCYLKNRKRARYERV